MGKYILRRLGISLVILLFVKIGAAYMDYRERGRIEWAPVAIIFAGLIFSLLAPQHIWGVLGI